MRLRRVGVEMWNGKFVLFENKNVKAIATLGSEEVEIQLKPDCEKRVIKMWEQLNEPIRRKKNALHTHKLL